MEPNDQVFTLLMNKLDGMDSKLDSLNTIVNRHEVDIQSAKLLGKLAHAVGWPALMAGLHHLWKQWGP